jgi:hypothetical protein
VLTRWGRELDREHPLPEYPRPQLVRDAWRNLNGVWEYAFTTTPDIPERWDGQIVVPFSPEAPLSGVGRQLQPDEWLFYRRTFTTPPYEGRVLLHFGAVDQSCTAWVNGIEVGTHVGGYLPFTLDITGALGGGEEELVVRVRDLSETGPHARGKQRLDRGTIWYTAQSGIWQTVWLEPVPQTYIASLDILPTDDLAAFDVTVHLSDGTTEQRRITPGDARRWTPEDPYLHHFEITVGADTVRTYGALRSFGVRRGRLLLNGEPYQHIGVLDQGYWPDGLLTAPSDEAMVFDIEQMKALGFTMLRKHVKIEPLRWYHHCDRLGMLVWQDMVNGGGRYRHLVTALPATQPIRFSDKRYELFFRGDAQARAEFREEVRRTVALLRNAPCVAVWVPFNEGWGQFDANDIAAEISALDPTRQVDQASGWIDQGGGDIRSFHRYVRRWRLPRQRDGRVIALDEYGGFTLRVEGHDRGEEKFGYRHFDTGTELAEAFTSLHRDVVAPTVPGGLAATVYTQLSDVEDELNGLFTWDREVLKIPAEVVRQALQTLQPPRQVG